MRRLVRRPIWLTGPAGRHPGYVARKPRRLGLGSLVLVQPLLATSLLFALPLGAWWAGRRLRRADGVWALVLTAALGVFLISGQPTAGVDTASISNWLIAAIFLAPLTAAYRVVAVRTRRLRCACGARVGIRHPLRRDGRPDQIDDEPAG